MDNKERFRKYQIDKAMDLINNNDSWILITESDTAGLNITELLRKNMHDEYAKQCICAEYLESIENSK
jgi:hypothetical protein